ncbi:MAG: hypothetical protein ACC661_01410, partial [Verrucomicrobiales bacterium]
RGLSASRKAREKLIEEANRRLEEARRNGALEKVLEGKEAAIKAAQEISLEELAAEAAAVAGALPDAQLAREQVARGMIEDAKRNLSKEAAAILAEPVLPPQAPTVVAQAGKALSDLAAPVKAAIVVTPQLQPAASAAAVAAPSPVARDRVVPATAETLIEPKAGKVQNVQKAGNAASGPAELQRPKLAQDGPQGAIVGDRLPSPVLGTAPTPAPARRRSGKGGEATEIDAKGGAFFHASDKIMIFTKDVTVNHPLFHLNCDKLEVFLKKDPAGKAETAGGGDPSTPGAAGTAAVPGSGEGSEISRAIATGYVVISKLSPNGDPQIGKCRHATFDNTTGDVTLRDYPQVQRGTDLVIATDRSTTIIFKPDGNMEVHGPHRTEIVKGVAAAASQP